MTTKTNAHAGSNRTGTGKDNTQNVYKDNTIMNQNVQEISTQLTLLQEEVFNQFVYDGEVIEVRIIGAYGKSSAWNGESAKGTVSGYFDNFKSFSDSVNLAIQLQQSNIYFTLQVIDPRLIGRAFNRLKPTSQTTSDNNVKYYRWIPIDIDPKRPAGVSSSESELQLAIETRDIILDYLLMTNRFKHIITAISGNGGHILIRIPKDIPTTPENRDYIKAFIEDLAVKFNTEYVDIDTTVFNPARIWKLYGTKAMKGDEVPANQFREALIHRWSYIDDMGGLI
jgi:hypothetical protein